jgi:hypothetical protein
MIMSGKTILITCISLITISCSQKTEDHADDEKAIKAHISRIFQAYISKDSQTVKLTHSENWRGFLTFSNRILRGIGDYMNDATAPGTFNLNNPWKLVGYKMLDYDIVFHEQTGIVSYIAELYWQQGKDSGSYKLRSIDIYGKEKGHWNQIASHIGTLPSDYDNQ